MTKRGGTTDPRRVLVVGAGVAGLEALIALRDLGSGHLDLHLVSPSATSALCSELIGRPWGAAVVPIDLVALSSALGVQMHLGRLASVDQLAHTVLTAGGVELGYDELLIATGAQPTAPYVGVGTLGLDPLSDQLGALRPGRLSIVVPPGVAWTLPAYQLALLAADDPTLPVEVITPERRPLELFGDRAPGLVTELLTHAGVRVLPRCIVPPGSDLFAMLDNVIALPLLRGPAISGLPAEGRGFLPVDGGGRVIGATAVHAAGDVTSRALKSGLAAQCGANAAADIARGAGTEPATRMLRGELVAQDGSAVYLRRALDGHDSGVASQVPLWDLDGASRARRLTAWMTGPGALL